MSSSTEVSTNKTPKTFLASPFELLFASIRLYRAYFWILIGYTAWLLFPAAGFYLLRFFPDSSLIQILEGALSLVDFGLTIWVSIIIILIIQAVIHNHSVEATSLKQQSLRLLRPTIGVLLLQLVFVVLGFVFLIIPGVIASVWLAFSQCAVILDGKKGIEALQWSRSLSQHRFFRVLYRLIVGPFVVAFVFSFISAFVIALVASMSGTEATALASVTPPPAWLDLIQSIFEIFLLPLLATYMVILYKHLKETRDDRDFQSSQTNA